MTGSTTGWRRAAVAVALAGVLALPACSHDDAPDATDLVAQAQSEQYAEEQAQQAQIKEANAGLPDRPRGEIAIDGASTISLTPDEVTRYQETGTRTVVDLADNGEEEAFRRLCSGKVDVVSSLRAISRSEWDACQAVGLDVVQFQVASDAIVIAIKSESDVGGDCLSTDQVQEIWRAGSPVTSWSQVGLDDVPLEVGGPLLDSTDFQVFGTSVLGSLAPALTDVRSDYFTYDDFNEALRFLNGGAERIQRALRYPDLARVRGARKSDLEAKRQVHFDARRELEAALAERAKGIRDRRSAVDQAADQARVDSARLATQAARAEAEAARARLQRAVERLGSATDAKRRVDATLGHVIYARFSDYEVYEDQLRPFEITLPDGHRNCVFPSQQTITDGEYPFASQMLITTTTRSLARLEVKDFIRHYLTTSQDAAAEARLVPVPDETLRAELAWIEGTHAPVLVVPAGGDTTTVDPEAAESAAPDPVEPAR
ncbi:MULTISPECIES: substrate-binding domain-containing protein [unclassified Nocardioides]|uniref:substrate-binding domain-containing protein n=1 Tax=unclassified Nocardioides TaxID=2615069 RepID=UPI0036196DE5